MTIEGKIACLFLYVIIFFVYWDLSSDLKEFKVQVVEELEKQRVKSFKDRIEALKSNEKKTQYEQR